MKLLITGGAGYIGHSLVNWLQKNCQNQITEIIIYDNLSRKNFNFFFSKSFVQIPLRFIEGDILDDIKLDKVLKGVDTILHLAARVTTPDSDEEAHFFDQVNHWGTSILVSAAERNKIEKFIYVSSTSVYGKTTDLASEESEPNPISFYANSKWQAENQTKRLNKKMAVFVLRLANVYGYNPAIRFDAIINKFMFNAHFNGLITINGDGHQKRTYIHVEKAAHFIGHTIAKNIPTGIYNLLEHNFSVLELSISLQSIYPNLEIINSNYNLAMHDLLVQSPTKIQSYVQVPKKDFLTELEEFKRKFAF